ncbi:MAG: hypothetical protein KA712_07500 [Myxococcales bacterium]|nr:hypothetical protein [Myxococcales bacterium]
MERMAQRLLGHMAPALALTPASRMRVAVALRAAQHRSGSRWRGLRFGVAWWALASVGVTSFAVGATAVHRVWQAHTDGALALVPQPTPVRRRVVQAPPPPEVVAIPAEIHMGQALPEPPLEVTVSVAAPRRSAVRPSVRAPETAAAPPPAPAVAVSPSALLEESQRLEVALRHLRQGRDGEKALAALDDYGRRFPHGALGQEAARARVEALLSLGRSHEALQRLESVHLGPAQKDLELQVLRGELRGKARRCKEAMQDFSVVLARVRGGPMAERALFGRASCHLATQDHAAARDDLRAYSQRFPKGRFASEVARGLAALE